MRRDLFLSVLLLAGIGVSNAEESPWTTANRIAISADGNPDADADDVGASPISLAMLAKAGLQENLVHYDFNNFLNYKRIDPGNNRMWQGAMGGQARWGFDKNRFFDAAVDPQGAVAHLTEEINKSTAADPLYLIVAGPMELIFQALEAAEPEARKRVILVSHHNYNEYFKARLWHRNWNDVQALVPEIGYLRIKDQNGWDGSGLKGKGYADFYWLRDHADPNLNWVYERIRAGKPDVSDAGMLAWLMGISGDDEMVTIQEMRQWFGPDLVPAPGGVPETPAAPAGVEPEVIPPAADQVFLEVDGKLVIEAESVPLSRGWKNDGTGAIRWEPPEGKGVSHQHQGELMYTIRISNPGKYRMALKSAHDGAGLKDDWSSCYTLMGLNPVSPYGNTRKTGFPANENSGFTWDTAHKNYGAVRSKEGRVSEPVYDLSAGDHCFWICGRSSGFRIDKIHFFKTGIAGFKSDSEAATLFVTGN
ncbi:hypothetical protein [Pontiella agarivorans]|uniref:Uncharacterized protein n=1 Tax=Pontiella agarivorans TaxID=3038953 RepID=A0ABU5N255_9BACT|nr:hypothetical protein [Pontiella agarivorans]MDZ8120523.1 hypothetical protein [Pontiella agarivorans]